MALMALVELLIEALDNGFVSLNGEVSCTTMSITAFHLQFYDVIANFRLSYSQLSCTFLTLEALLSGWNSIDLLVAFLEMLENPHTYTFLHTSMNGTD